MRIWTYTVINWDVFNDDPQDEAEAIAPRVAWFHKEEARKAADQDNYEQWVEMYDSDGPIDVEEYQRLEWTTENNGDQIGRSKYSEEVWRLYSMEVK